MGLLWGQLRAGEEVRDEPRANLSHFFMAIVRVGLERQEEIVLSCMSMWRRKPRRCVLTAAACELGAARGIFVPRVAWRATDGPLTVAMAETEEDGGRDGGS